MQVLPVSSLEDELDKWRGRIKNRNQWFGRARKTKGQSFGLAFYNYSTIQEPVYDSYIIPCFSPNNQG